MSVTENIQLGKYEYNENDLIGQGQYGDVFKGQEISTKKPVAIKVVNKDYYRENPDLEGFLKKEIAILKSLSHYNIVKLFLDLETDTEVIIVQEFCEDGDLKQVLQNFKYQIPENKALKILKQLLEAFYELMSKGIVHRDLKPDNILFKNGILKLADFGLSEQITNFHRAKMNYFAGSPVYMSPQVLQNLDYTYKCDIWSIGCMYYEILCGVTPFEAQTMQDLLNNQKRQKFKFNKNISPLSKDFILKCLKYDEIDRINIDQIFQHPLFENAFDYRQKIEKMDKNAQKIMLMIYNSYKARNIDLQSLFESIDIDKNGEVDMEEFTNFIKNIEPNLKRHQIEYIFNVIDDNESNSLSFGEFMDYFNGFEKQKDKLSQENNNDKKQNNVDQNMIDYLKSKQNLKSSFIQQEPRQSISLTQRLSINQRLSISSAQRQSINQRDSITNKDQSYDKILQIMDKYKNRSSFIKINEQQNFIENKSSVIIDDIINKYKAQNIQNDMNKHQQSLSLSKDMIAEKRVSNFKISEMVKSIKEKQQINVDDSKEIPKFSNCKTSTNQQKQKISFYEPVSSEFLLKRGQKNLSNNYQIDKNKDEISYNNRIKSIVEKYSNKDS